MFNLVKNSVFLIGLVMVLTAQSYSNGQPAYRNQGWQQSQNKIEPTHTQTKIEPTHTQTKSEPVKTQIKREPTHTQTWMPDQPNREVPKQGRDRKPEYFQGGHQEWEAPRVYAVVPPVVVENNNFLHRHHHKNWKPRYNYYDNQYHFYPYVNIASSVELTGVYSIISFNGQTYFYDEGTFYQQYQLEYVAVVPPIGIIVNSIPDDARQIVSNGQLFFRFKGVFYVRVDQGYQVVEPIEMGPEDSQ